MTSENDEQQKRNTKPTKHALVMRGVVAPIFGLLAVLFIVLGALNATVWKPAKEITADTSVSGAQYVVTDPGMLNLLNKTVTVKVKTTAADDNGSKSAKGENADSSVKTCVAMGSSKDATGWLAGQDYTRITGLQGWKTLSSKTAKGQKLASSGTADGEVAFKDSDMWSSVQCSNGTISMNLNDVKADQVMVIDTGISSAKSGSDTADAASGSETNASGEANASGDSSDSAKKVAQPKLTLTMHWVRQQVPDHATPLFIVAAVCAVLTVLSASIFAISANESVKRKREARREKREAAKAEEISISEAMTGSFAVLRTSIVHTTHNHRASHKKVAPVDTPAAPVGMSDDGNALASASNGLAGADNGDGFDDETSADDVSTPSIIDPTRRNLVADMQMRSDDDKSAETLPSDESGNGVGRHRGASEQESESDANQEGKVGRHSRFAPEADGQAAASVQAPVAVSLDESSRSSDDAGETNKDGEGRRTSSADAVIDEGHAEDETSVISLDELRAYYARFSQEDDEKDETPSQDAEHEKADANTDETDDNETVVKQAKKTEETGQQVDDDGDKPQANEDDHKAEEDA